MAAIRQSALSAGGDRFGDGHERHVNELGGPAPIGNTTCAGGGFPTVWTSVLSSGAIWQPNACVQWTDNNGTSSYWGNATLTNTSWTSWCSGAGAVCVWTLPACSKPAGRSSADHVAGNPSIRSFHSPTPRAAVPRSLAGPHHVPVAKARAPLPPLMMVMSDPS